MVQTASRLRTGAFSDETPNCQWPLHFFINFTGHARVKIQLLRWGTLYPSPILRYFSAEHPKLGFPTICGSAMISLWNHGTFPITRTLLQYVHAAIQLNTFVEHVVRMLPLAAHCSPRFI